MPLSLKIGPSGVRGVIGESLTPQLVTSFAAAFGTYCGAGPILVGTDTRPSGEMVKQAAIAGLLSVGCTPVDAGIVPLPALMLHVREAGAFGGISVGGSHGALEWSALRFIGSGGLALRANQVAELTDLYHQGFFPRVRAQDMSDVRADSTSCARHLRAVTQTVDLERIRTKRFTVAADPGGGAASTPTLRLLGALGCDVVSVAGTDAAPPAHQGPDEGSLAELGELVRRSGADVGFSQDADADRLYVVDERGTPLGPDATVVLVVQRWLERKPGPVVVNASTSRVVDDVAARFECPVYRSRVGEAHVIEAMNEHGAEAGGEGDGGAIVLPVNPCRDSFAAMALILESMAVSERSVGALRAQVPCYSMVRERLLCSARDVAPSLRLIKSLFPGERFDLTDGVKVTWPDRWLLARPSANEPVIRLEAEAPTEADARSLVNRVLEVLSPGA
ncbi:MAG TPA: phosphoglucosamine mutase [Vicinamibacteria bacterium]|nr:phosphoglucosamine mutase [Vicinamibacteria bacterium]